LWKQTGPQVEPDIAATKAAWSGEINFESSQPPLYYIVTSIWWWLGKRIGLLGIQALYWIRFLNVLLIALVVWLSYVTAQMIAPERVEFRVGVPLLIAFLPQNVFYAINNDILSPLCFGLLFLCSLQWLRAQTGSVWLGAVTGLAGAAAYLTKLSTFDGPRGQESLPWLRCFFWPRSQLGFGWSGRKSTLVMPPARRRRSCCWVGRESRSTIGGGIRFLHRTVFGFSGRV